MGRRRRKAIIEELFEVLFDATDMFWQVGAVVSIALTVVMFFALDWVNSNYDQAAASPNLGQLTHSYGWIFYLLPIMIAVIAVFFALKSYQSFCRTHRY